MTPDDDNSCVMVGGYMGTTHRCKKCGDNDLYDKNKGTAHKCTKCGRPFNLYALPCMGCGREVPRPHIDLGNGRSACDDCLGCGIRVSRMELAAIARGASSISDRCPVIRVSTRTPLRAEELNLFRRKHRITITRRRDGTYGISAGRGG